MSVHCNRTDAYEIEVSSELVGCDKLFSCMLFATTNSKTYISPQAFNHVLSANSHNQLLIWFSLYHP